MTHAHSTHLTAPRSLVRVRRVALLLLASALSGVGCYGGGDLDAIAQESAVCGEDLVVPTTYTCTRALSNLTTRGAFVSAPTRAAEGAGRCTISCECDWRRIGPAPSCGSNRLADGALVPLCADEDATSYTMAVREGVASQDACDHLALLATNACAQVCQLAATNPDALREPRTGEAALSAQIDSGHPVELRPGAPIIEEHTDVMYCCAPNPLRRPAAERVTPPQGD
jgi:hypothetical protein